MSGKATREMLLLRATILALQNTVSLTEEFYALVQALRATGKLPREQFSTKREQEHPEESAAVPENDPTRKEMARLLKLLEDFDGGDVQ